MSHNTFGHLFRFLYNIIGIPLGFVHFGIPGAIIVVALNDVPFYVVISFGVIREGLSSLSQDVKATLIFVGLLGILIYARWLLGFGLPIAGIL